MTASRGIRVRRGSGSRGKQGLLISSNGKQRLEHVLIAEKVLGKPLPAGAVVHHVDKNNLNNKNSNLVICQDQSYHMLIHLRQRAYDACGNPDWRKCAICKKYDQLENLQKSGKSSFRHRSCIKEYNRRLLLSKQ